MAISVNGVYVDAQAIILKELGSGYMPPSIYNTFANMAQRLIFEDLAKDYQQTQLITDKIRPFISRKILRVDSNGQVQYPSDYVNFITALAFDFDDYQKAVADCGGDFSKINYYALREVAVKVIDNAKVGYRISSPNFTPDINNPIATLYGTYLQMRPTNMGSVIFEYLRQPADVIWNFTVGGNGIEVYNPTGSVDFEWGYNIRNKIVIAICNYFGVSIREPDLFKYTEQLQTEQA